MQDELIKKIAELMSAQSAAYASLEALTKQLIGALVKNEPHGIESITRAGEGELLRMRSRLLEITNGLTSFGELRRQQASPERIDDEARESFESAAKNLLDAARGFEKIAGRVWGLTFSGSSFATACIQMCGVPPTTYNPPVLKYSKGVTAR